MNRIRFFKETDISSQCDVCNGRVDLVRGGICASCKRILCFRHLHGSRFRRLIADLGGDARCVDCRAGQAISGE